MITFILTGAISAALVSDTWVSTSPMAVARSQHTMTELGDGRILAVGGLDASNTPTSSCEIYDPNPGVWITAGSLRFARSGHTTSLLEDGRVMVTGGFNTNKIRRCEIFDPTLIGAGGSVGVWRTVASMNRRRAHHAANVIDNDTLMVSGGSNRRFVVLADCEIYSISTNTWVIGASMMDARDSHVSVTLPTSGRVFVCGGYDNNAFRLATCEIYDPATDSWLDVSRRFGNQARAGHTATYIPVVQPFSGIYTPGILLVGGRSATGGNAEPELYLPGFDIWIKGYSGLSSGLMFLREDHTEAIFGNEVVIVGGRGRPVGGGLPSVLDQVEVFDPLTITWSTAGNLVTARDGHGMARSGSGVRSLIVSGGRDSSGLTLSSVERGQ